MPLSRAVVDRAAERRFDAGLLPGLLAAPSTRVLLVCGGRVAVSGEPPALAQLTPEQCRHLTGTWAFLGSADGVEHVALALPEAESDALPDAGAWFDIRDIGGRLSDADTGLAVTALSLARWHATHRFCPACGTPTEPAESGWASHCPGCGATHYPRTDPAVIMAIIDDDDRLLLGRGVAWRNSKRFSVLAGYVEAGESLEAAVRREVAEEVGVTVGEVRYVGNQPWPPSGSLMVAFEGRALTNELRVQRSELADALWVTRAELDRAEARGDIELPPPAAIAHTLIAAWRAAG